MVYRTRATIFNIGNALRFRLRDHPVDVVIKLAFPALDVRDEVAQPVTHPVTQFVPLVVAQMPALKDVLEVDPCIRRDLLAGFVAARRTPIPLGQLTAT